MDSIKIYQHDGIGKIKPMHATNNGPVYKLGVEQQITNIDAFKSAGIPYIRTHDTSFYAAYGGEHTVDVHAIFPDFDKGPYDAGSYDFTVTDNYMKVMACSGAKVFYRLGSKIEHGVKKYGTLPPKDFKKWAVICEHIIRHYTEGWAEGFDYDIDYWEIWNEPDLDPDDSENKRTWGGTKKQFFEFYNIAAKHLKDCFPHLKIGGPAIAYNLDWLKDFLTQLTAPLDFCSWHIYASEPQAVADRAKAVRKLLDDNGFKNTESILNEWNYVKGWSGEEWKYSVKTIKSKKGAAFTASVMCVCQDLPVDMLMYYDARPATMNGMFYTDLVCELLKGYYPFKMFNDVYKRKKEIKCEVSGTDIYAISAADEAGKTGTLIVYYTDEEDMPPKQLVFESESELHSAKAYLLDGEKDCLCIGGINSGDIIKMQPNTVLLITEE
ncbi:MAG: hypothetical protein IJH37_07180 [Clostridia bacterium]|nr:hypothetical protein [Clostridia bacterium]